MMKNNVRYVALTILDDVLNGEAYSNLQLNEAIKNEAVTQKDIGLLTELVYGTLQRKITLEYLIEPFIQTKLKGWMKRLLIMSAYQFVYLDKVPNHAIINEAVNIAKARGDLHNSKAINAILRNFISSPLRSLDEIKHDDKRLSIEGSVPLWLTKHWITHFGYEKTKEMCLLSLTPPDTTVRVNTTRITVQEAVERLESNGYTVKMDKDIERCLHIKGEPIVNDRLFKDGLISIQDKSSMFVGEILNVKKGSTVLDTCSAPGGKTCHIAEMLDQTGQVDAFDIHPHKIDLIDFNVKKLRLNNVSTSVHDATKPFDKTYDYILVDAPCSGFGVMRRKPEIKYDKTTKDVEALWHLQVEILENASKSLAPGGELVYSTCTIEQMENENVVYSFLKANDDFEFAPFIDPRTNEETKTLQLLPQDYNSDGFFITKIKRKER
ncbi:16S rRNA (cytosine(967)-C(5))-methyltransferase RsmB [Mammaliicoccus stepanovicii]|uniref:16S rRNA (cytosine(967)-C(5))-methyltransferase n=1 Tax=Mammaliicoccus stepanovicii TaxID=643214 RepID=A0A239ZJH2_9STAP|nr:16S rRNA (cytosine(967)-C(5))-methyltransferase RsmB [Mammaliicoccus stepanovicii]PNZ77955.1 16S rRNA (cytosine(967)-C(5))-methyltransferase RsmB [Mammaliicoccus stepanovicii]GGI41695.1 ribosomal RNA small subunit methyltransferase B [Mammaliicoccus stepanovicii]SNV71087.1 tRNA and rRNA cytosine-C5-methylase [Mammaliicoccus stepanovicii]